MPYARSLRINIAGARAVAAVGYSSLTLRARSLLGGGCGVQATKSMRMLLGRDLCRRVLCACGRHPPATEEPCGLRRRAAVASFGGPSLVVQSLRGPLCYRYGMLLLLHAACCCCCCCALLGAPPPPAPVVSTDHFFLPRSSFPVRAHRPPRITSSLPPTSLAQLRSTDAPTTTSRRRSRSPHAARRAGEPCDWGH